MKMLIICILFSPILVQAQKGDTVLRYLDQELNFTTAKKALFLGVSIKRENSWYVYALYPDTTPLLKAYYKDKTLKIKEGPYTLYYPKNIKAQEGTYFNNKKFGVWKFWYATGILKDSGFMKENIMVGGWKSWYPNSQLMVSPTFADLTLTPGDYVYKKVIQENTEISGMKSGPFTSWFQNGTVEATGMFENNTMTGTWTWYHENGNKATIEKYENGGVTALTCFDSTGKETGDMCSLSKPALLKTYGDYKQFIYQNLTWPEEAKKKQIEGNVKVSFLITKQGQLENLTIVSDYPILNKAVEELFSSMKEWYPAVSHNRNIDSYEEMIIPFRLNQ